MRDLLKKGADRAFDEGKIGGQTKEKYAMSGMGSIEVIFKSSCCKMQNIHTFISNLYQYVLVMVQNVFNFSKGDPDIFERCIFLGKIK